MNPRDDKVIKTEKIINYLVDSLTAFRSSISQDDNLEAELDRARIDELITDINTHRSDFQQGLTPKQILDKIIIFEATLKTLKLDNKKSNAAYKHYLDTLLSGLEPSRKELSEAIQKSEGTTSKSTSTQFTRQTLYATPPPQNADLNTRQNDDLFKALLNDEFIALSISADTVIAQISKHVALDKTLTQETRSNLSLLTDLLTSLQFVLKEEMKGKNKKTEKKSVSQTKDNDPTLVGIIAQYVDSIYKLELEQDNKFKVASLDILRVGLQKIAKIAADTNVKLGKRH